MPARSNASESSRILLLLLIAMVGFLVTTPALAQITSIEPVESIDFDEDEDYPWLLLGITGFAGSGGVDMEDLNEGLRLTNNVISTQGSTGIRYNRFASTISLGGGVRAIVKERYVLQMDLSSIFRTTSVGGAPTSISEVSIPASVYSATLGYDFIAKRTLAFGVAAGAAWYSSNAEQVVRRTQPGQDEVELGKITMNGTTVGPVFQLFFEAKFTDRLFVNVTGGYRLAKLDDLEIGGVTELEESIAGIQDNNDFIFVPIGECLNCEEPVDPPEGEDPPAPEPEELVLRGGGTSLDWTGFTGRVALTWYLNIPTF